MAARRPPLPAHVAMPRTGARQRRAGGRLATRQQHNGEEEEEEKKGRADADLNAKRRILPLPRYRPVPLRTCGERADVKKAGGGSLEGKRQGC